MAVGLLKKYAPQASSASPRHSYSGVRRPLDLPHTTSSKPGRTAIECDNKLGSDSRYARSGCNPITHYITKTQDKQTGGNWQLMTGWRVAGCERGTRHPGTKTQKQEPRRRSGQAVPPGACRVSNVHCACALAPAPGRGLMWARGLPAALLRRCDWLRTPRCRSQRQRAR